MNVYSELLDLLRQERREEDPVLFGTLSGIAPLTVTVYGTSVSEGLFAPKGTVYHREDIGALLALLPCREGFLILFQAEEVSGI